ncbi:MAG TPA: cysteine desulfurase [Parachlamydiaceae bacterium]|nr:cysteine desulfurase [Parachlamydiaceae bacterium]
MPPFPVFKLREDFPLLKQKMHGKPLVYLDSAATAQKPNSVIDAMQDFYQNHYGTVHRAIYQLSAYATAEYEKARTKVQRLLNAAKREEIIFARGTTEAINMVAYSFGKAFLLPGDEIIISEMEHHSNIVPWQMACEDRGAKLKVIPMNDQGELDLEKFAALLSDKVKLVAITHVSNALGTVNPIKKIIEMAHHTGAKCLIDGAQSVPHMPVDVQDLDADFYVFSGHKVYGPTGIGILYGKEDLLNAMPPYQGGGDMIQTVEFAKTTYNTLPLKFEAGTPMIAEVIGLGAAIDYMESIGLEAIHAYEQELLEHATAKIKAIEGISIIGEAAEKGAILTFKADDVHPLDLATLLDLQGIAIRTGHHCAQPVMRHFGVTSLSRASFALYNTKEEIDYFIDSLQKNLKQLR